MAITEMRDLDDLEACLKASETAPVFIYKHSTRCPTSGNAHIRLREVVASPPPAMPDVHLVKVIEARPVSNAIADLLGIAHQSPQLILVIGRKAVWSTSHHDIRAESIQAALAAHLAA